MPEDRRSLTEVLLFLRDNFGKLKQLLSGSVPGLPKPLGQLAKSPLGFILGVMLSRMLKIVEVVLEAILTGIAYVMLGEDERIIVEGTDFEPQGFWGLADVPLGIAWLLVSAGRTVGDLILDAVRDVVAAVLNASLMLGPGAPVGIGLAIAGFVLLSVWLLRQLLGLVSAIPVVGNLVEVVLP